MSGNVYQWVEDCWHENYTGAPSDGSVWGMASCEKRVLRGGSWDGSARSTRAAIRSGNGPAERGGINGFRLARTLP